MTATTSTRKRGRQRARPAPVPNDAIAPAAAPGLDVPKLTRNTLNDEVYEQLKRALMSGALMPGSTITIRSLAASFGISPMPVREALRRLVAEHVLVMLPNRSAALPVMTRERFREVTRIRTSLEGLAAEEGAARIGGDTIDKMVEFNDLMERTDPARHVDYLAANREFHFALYRSAGMPTLLSMIESLWLQIGPLLNIQHEAIAQQEPIILPHHHHALRALRRGDAKRVRKAIVDDIEDAAKIIAARLDSARK